MKQNFVVNRSQMPPTLELQENYKDVMQVSAAFPGGRPPGNSRATPGLGTEFVLKSRPGDRGFSLHLYFEN